MPTFSETKGDAASSVNTTHSMVLVAPFSGHINDHFDEYRIRIELQTGLTYEISLTGDPVTSAHTSEILSGTNMRGNPGAREVNVSFFGLSEVVGGGGNDELYGDDGADIFRFAPGHGNDTIMDFSDREDRINLSDFDIEDLSAVTIITGQDRVTLDLTDHGGGTVELPGIERADLDASDFLF